MEFIIFGVIIVAMVVGIFMWLKKKSLNEINQFLSNDESENTIELSNVSKQLPEFSIKMEMLPAESKIDENRLSEITDSKVLEHVNNLIPGFMQAGNAANNVAQAVEANGEVLYRAIIPAGAQLTNSRAMDNAVRGIYHGADGIKGHANLVAVEAQKGTTIVANSAAAAMGVAAMVVGQYYMTQINTELGAISESISKISEFQDNEYRSRVFSLIAHIKKIAEFQTEILENEELRMIKIAQLDSLEEECTQLLGQANLSLAGYSKKTDLNYDEYETELKNAQDWYMYQHSLLDTLYKISDLRYTLYLGTVSREHCEALIPTYSKQVADTQERIINWHKDNIGKFNIDTKEIRRKRAGVDGVVHFVPGLFNNALNFKTIEKSTAKIIMTQTAEFKNLQKKDTLELFADDVQLISKNGKIFYLPNANGELENHICE